MEGFSDASSTLAGSTMSPRTTLSSRRLFYEKPPLTRFAAAPLPQKVTFASAKRLQARAFNADLLTANFLRLKVCGVWLFYSGAPPAAGLSVPFGRPTCGRNLRLPNTQPLPSRMVSSRICFDPMTQKRHRFPPRGRDVFYLSLRPRISYHSS